MDKETLSNYGWIVICVLVLAVMLALATPFGTFVADGFKATYTGLFQTGDNALDVGLNAVGVKNTLDCGHGRKEAGDHSQKECGHYNCQDTDCGCVPASCGVEGHWSGDGLDHTTYVGHDSSSYYMKSHSYACECPSWVVPEGGVYVNNKDRITYNAGDTVPCLRIGDSYTFGNYEYRYCYEYSGTGWIKNTSQNGWGVRCADGVAEPGDFLREVFNEPITSLVGTFRSRNSVTTVPTIPEGIVNIDSMFTNSRNIKTYIGSTDPDGDFSNYTIPNTVTNMAYTFCQTNITHAPKTIPNSVTNVDHTFSYNDKLLVAPVLPESVTDMEWCFYDCENLITYHGSLNSDGDFSNYVIPSKVKSLYCAFAFCEKITKIPVVPNGVTNLSCAFEACSVVDLSDYIVPETVTDMDGTFHFCSKMTATPIMPCSLASKNYTYYSCSATFTYYHVDGCDGSCGK